MGLEDAIKRGRDEMAEVPLHYEAVYQRGYVGGDVIGVAVREETAEEIAASFVVENFLTRGDEDDAPAFEAYDAGRFAEVLALWEEWDDTGHDRVWVALRG